MTYVDKLKDPRWQKKRLEILSRDKWRCFACGSTTKTLHVHHKSYSDGVEPWEYPDYMLTTLCEECHDVLHSLTERSIDHFAIASALRCLATSIVDGHLNVEIQRYNKERVDLLAKDERTPGEAEEFHEKHHLLVRNIESAFASFLATYAEGREQLVRMLHGMRFL